MLSETFRLFRTLDVFREGAENGTRGARAPHLNFGFRVEHTGSGTPSTISAR